MPYIYGEGIANLQDVDYVIVKDEPLLEHEEYVPEYLVQKIGRNVARLVEDGATIRVGWGGMPDAVLSHLSDKRHLGLHSDLFTDGVAELMREGFSITAEKASTPE